MLPRTEIENPMAWPIDANKKRKMPSIRLSHVSAYWPPVVDSQSGSFDSLQASPSSLFDPAEEANVIVSMIEIKASTMKLTVGRLGGLHQLGSE